MTGLANVHPRTRTRGCKDYSHSIEPHCAPAHATLSHLLITTQLLTRPSGASPPTSKLLQDDLYKLNI